MGIAYGDTVSLDTSLPAQQFLKCWDILETNNKGEGQFGRAL